VNLRGARVAVTGASGFVGRYLVRALLERGAHVIAVVRSPSKVPQLHREGITVRAADLSDRDALARAFEGACALLSNAAVVGLGGVSADELAAVNVEGTKNALQAAHDAGVLRVVMTSSAAAYRPKRGHAYAEGDALYDLGDRVGRFKAYSRSKGVAERAAWRLAEQLDLQLTTFRPHAIHGAFDPHGPTLWLPRLMRLPVGVWVKRMAFPSVYAGDLADAACRMLEREVSIGRAYNVTGEPTTDFWALFEAYRDAGGRVPPVVVPVPVPMRRTYDLRRAAEDLGWSNRPLVDGLRETLALHAADAL
jgi:nucleoside-diphosphate-sugar epimerase